MSKFISVVKSLFRKEEGATMVEYGLMISLIAILCIGAVTALSGGIQATFNAAAAAL